MWKSAVVAVFVLLASCGKDASGPPAPPNLSGLWTYSDNISSPGTASCNSAGTVNIAQTGTSFTGNGNATSGVCTIIGDPTLYDNTGPFTVTGGSLNGNQVSFQSPGCTYTGTISGSPVNAMSGTETCTLAAGGTNFTFTGPWQASR